MWWLQNYLSCSVHWLCPSQKYTHTYITYICMHICMYLCLYTHIYMFVCTYICMYVYTHIYNLDICSGVLYLYHMVVLFLIFLKSHNTISILVVPFVLPQRVHECFPFLIFFPGVLSFIICFLNFSKGTLCLVLEDYSS